MTEQTSKCELLQDKVVDLVREFINSEGGITPADLEFLFGPISSIGPKVAKELSTFPIAIQ